MKPTIALILPTFNHLDYAEKAAASFLQNTDICAPKIIAVDDASDDLGAEYYAWAEKIGALHSFRFPVNGGLTRSWNYGLRVARSMDIDIAVLGNSDIIFSPGWDRGMVAALKEYQLVGPVTNAAGWGSARQYVNSYVPTYKLSDADHDIARVALDLTEERPIPLALGQMQFERLGGARLWLAEFLNGFCLIANTKTWWRGAFDQEDVLNPAHAMTENEVEIQFRWALWARRAIVPSSFVFHYRAVSRGDSYVCPGAHRMDKNGSS